MEAAGGIGGYIMKEDIHEKLSAKMHSSLRNSNKYVIDNNTWNALQNDVSSICYFLHIQFNTLNLNKGSVLAILNF